MSYLTSTKIICTVGPSLSDKQTFKTMIQQGITIFRLNFSHSFESERSQIIKNIREAGKELETVVTMCLDTKGYEFRIEITHAAEINFKPGREVSFSNKRGHEDIFIPVKDFSKIRIGQIFYIDDGFLKMQVTEIGTDVMRAKALTAHRLPNNKKTIFPGLVLKTTVDPDSDKKDVEYGIENGIDVIFASFINSADDVIKLKQYVKNQTIPIYSKIETLSGIKNLDKILEASDGVMVARGDLGIETTFSELFKVQKEVCAKAIEYELPVICATQMLESMILSTVPTRAEISDIGNAVLDGYDALMLCEETAIGQNSLHAADAMKKVIENAERYVNEHKSKDFNNRLIGVDTDVCLLMKINSFKELTYIAKKKGNMPVFLYSDNMKLLSASNIYKGIYPLYKANSEITNIAQFLKETYGFTRVYNITYDEEFNAFKELKRL